MYKKMIIEFAILIFIFLASGYLVASKIRDVFSYPRVYNADLMKK